MGWATAPTPYGMHIFPLILFSSILCVLGRAYKTPGAARKPTDDVKGSGTHFAGAQPLGSQRL